MATVKVKREAPVKPPVKEITITLSEAEGVGLAQLLGWGIASKVLNDLNLADLYIELEKSLGTVKRPFFFRWVATRENESA